ncbi:MAG: ABC transporter ATP-binding protein/permease [Defluviitaleaceae bacterium]|nr:ABC transporter ATP-binding protein/permease [Defluviitaleaceae bacterium]
MKRIFTAYKDLLSIIFKEAPVMVVLTFICAVVTGLLTPIGVYVNQNVFDGGLAVAAGTMRFEDYTVYLVLFVAVALLPNIIYDLFVFNYVQPRSLLVLRTAYKGRMLQKLKTMKYEHFESEQSMEIIDKAYNRAENSARHLWPMYVAWTLSSIVASAGIIYHLARIEWWLVLTVLAPFILQVVFVSKKNLNIYDELEHYWNKERRYNILGWCLRSRDFAKEMKAFGNAGWLRETYVKRLNARNKEYEGFYFKHLKRNLLGYNITKIAPVANVLLLLYLFLTGPMSIGTLIAMSMVVFNQAYMSLGGSTILFRASGWHIKFYDYYDKFFNLSDEAEGAASGMPKNFSVEFKDVWFKYPGHTGEQLQTHDSEAETAGIGTDKYVLKGLSFKVEDGMKASVVGENGEGKSTMVKLLLGLFTPNSGEILVGGKNLNEYPLSVRAKIFGPVFQDFPRYSITLAENIGVGNIDEISDEEKIIAAAKKGKADEFAKQFENGYATLLGRDFEGGVDVSGGQWQRIAIARAFMGDKPVLLLDEPTSQLDPMAEAALYNEFAGMTENKTALFITHRLGSTMITDKIFVISDGKIAEEGTHDGLMETGGIYAEMFNAQKQWYIAEGKEGTPQEFLCKEGTPQEFLSKEAEANA